MTNSTNASIIRPPRIVMSPPPGGRPRLQAHAIWIGHHSTFGHQIDAAWRLIAEARPDLVEIHCGSEAFDSFREHLREQGRDDSEPVAIGPAGLEATVYKVASLRPTMLVFMTSRAS